jgi:hypothetical protein
MDLRNGLQLDDKCVLDQQIDTKPRAQKHAIVMNRNRHLAFEMDARLRQFDLQALRIDAFEKAGSERSMDLDGRTDHHSSQAVL